MFRRASFCMLCALALFVFRVLFTSASLHNARISGKKLTAYDLVRGRRDRKQYHSMFRDTFPYLSLLPPFSIIDFGDDVTRNKYFCYGSFQQTVFVPAAYPSFEVLSYYICLLAMRVATASIAPLPCHRIARRFYRPNQHQDQITPVAHYSRAL